MKKIKKIIISSLVVLSLLLSINGVNALVNMSTTSLQTGINQLKADKKNTKTGSLRIKLKEKRLEVKNLRKDKKDMITNSKKEIKLNWNNFKEENKDKIKTSLKGISKETRKSLKEMKNTYKNEIKSLRDSLKEEDISFEKKLEILEQIKDLREKRFGELKVKLNSNPEALKVIELRKSVFEENQVIRSKISEKRKEFRAKRAGIIEKYKILIIKKIGSRIDKMNETRLNKLNERIDKMYSKIEANFKLDKARQTKILTLLEGLKSTIKAKLEMLQAESFDIVDDVLSEVE